MQGTEPRSPLGDGDGQAQPATDRCVTSGKAQSIPHRAAAGISEHTASARAVPGTWDTQ